jgi:hypothetical protein
MSAAHVLDSAFFTFFVQQQPRVDAMSVSGFFGQTTIDRPAAISVRNETDVTQDIIFCHCKSLMSASSPSASHPRLIQLDGMKINVGGLLEFREISSQRRCASRPAVWPAESPPVRSLLRSHIRRPVRMWSNLHRRASAGGARSGTIEAPAQSAWASNRLIWARLSVPCVAPKHVG